jgi:hypothetical protein
MGEAIHEQKVRFIFRLLGNHGRRNIASKIDSKADV